MQKLFSGSSQNEGDPQPSLRAAAGGTHRAVTQPPGVAVIQGPAQVLRQLGLVDVTVQFWY